MKGIESKLLGISIEKRTRKRARVNYVVGNASHKSMLRIKKCKTALVAIKARKTTRSIVSFRLIYV